VTELHSVPCQCVWLEVSYQHDKVIAICKWCRQRGEFPLSEWETMLYEGTAINKPTVI